MYLHLKVDKEPCVVREIRGLVTQEFGLWVLLVGSCTAFQDQSNILPPVLCPDNMDVFTCEETLKCNSHFRLHILFLDIYMKDIHSSLF